MLYWTQWLGHYLQIRGLRPTLRAGKRRERVLEDEIVTLW